MPSCADCPVDSNPVATANRLMIIGDRRTVQAVDEYCARDTRLGGCNKFTRCDLHPDYLKDLPIAEIMERYPDEYNKLKDLRCLRPLIHEHRAAFQRAELTLGDYIGAPRETRNSSQAANLIAKHHCIYHGCAVPEAAELYRDRPSEQSGGKPAYHRSCPVGRVRTSSGVVENQTRLLACDVTQKDFRDFQQRYGIESIAPVAIVPGTHDVAREVIYLGKDPQAAYQYVSWLHEVPFPDVRLVAPRIVRHLTADESATPWTFGNENPTMASFVITPETASEFELDRQVRYIPCGEFMFLLLAWLWTGERRRPRDIQARRTVVLESIKDIPRSKSGRADLLFQALKREGFGEDLERLFGLQIANTDEVLRISARLDDFKLLGLIRDGYKGIEITERGECLTRWLAEAIGSLGRDASVTDQPSVISPSRIRALFGANPSNNTLRRLQSAAGSLRDGMRARAGNRWCDALAALLNGLPRRAAPWTKRLRGVDDCQRRRDQLRAEAFPVYPVVHLIMFAGYEWALDWVAIPLGGPIVPATTTLRHPPPQAGAFVLFRAGSASKPRDVINALRPVLSVPAFVDGAKWINEVIGRKQAVVDFVTVMLARGHEAGDLTGLLAFAESPRARGAKLSDALKQPQRRQKLGIAIGKIISFAKLADWDQQFALAIRRDDWILPRARLPLGRVMRTAWKVLYSRTEAAGKDLELQAGVADLFLWAPEMALFHLLYEALLNVVRRDSRKAVVRVDFDQAASIAIWNPSAVFKQDFFEMLANARRHKRQVRKRAAAADGALRGVDVMLVLADIVGCRLNWKNATHPDTGRKAGVLRIKFHNLLTGGDS